MESSQSRCQIECNNLAADPKCPSCHGSGRAVIRTANITFAGGACKCVGGQVWAVAP